jgi:hypothetical protein
MYPAAKGGEREAKVAPFAGSHEGRGRMPDPEFLNQFAAMPIATNAETTPTAAMPLNHIT